MRYIFKKPFKKILIINATNTLELRYECRKLLGRKKSAKLSYKQIGSNSFRIENCLGLTVADVYLCNAI